MIRSPSIPYIVPFAALLGLLAARPLLALPALAVESVIASGTALALIVIARQVLDFRVRNWAGTVSVGILVFVLWVGPDVLFPGYREHWLFTNSLTGGGSSGDLSNSGPEFLTVRTLRASLVVPAAEELFWRAWLMRWLIEPEFQKVPLGAWSARAFWVVALLFASEHGSFWGVGLLAGALYNWWMVRTRSLGDLILAHGITNLCLSVYTMATGKWEYW